jgi:hypothetical protein
MQLFIMDSQPRDISRPGPTATLPFLSALVATLSSMTTFNVQEVRIFRSSSSAP